MNCKLSSHLHRRLTCFLWQFKKKMQLGSCVFPVFPHLRSLGEIFVVLSMSSSSQTFNCDPLSAHLPNKYSFHYFFFQYIKLYESSCQNIKKFPFCQLQNVVNNSQAQSTRRGLWWNCVVEFLTKSVAGKYNLQHNLVSDVHIQLLLSLCLANGKSLIKVSIY